MLRVYYITYTEDKGETYNRIAVPAQNIPHAYIELQLQIPDADITGVELTGKIITIKDSK